MNNLAVVTPSADRFFGPQFDLQSWGLPSSKTGLSSFDLPSLAVQPLLRTFRYGNTALDALFYDVGSLWLRLYTRGVTVSTQMAQQGSDAAEGGLATLQAAARFVNLSATASPEGSILVIDAHRPPFIYQFNDVKAFLAGGLKFPNAADAAALSIAPKDIHAITVTGVGSSALGSAAFAWNVSEAMHRPVAAIVPGYGLADLIPQALGGWYGFGLHDFLRRLTQQTLAAATPDIARVGRRLSATAPEAEAREEGREAFRSGSPESDILHDILQAAPQIKRLYGHSKGALCLQNGIRSLPPERYSDLHVTTFGCVVQEETAADYDQVLGRVDSLGQLNSWGNWPEQWVESWHSTNTMMPLTMRIGDLVTRDVRAEDPVNVNPDQLRAALAEALKSLLPADLLAAPKTAN
jgi:hypothetical protein